MIFLTSKPALFKRIAFYFSLHWYIRKVTPVKADGPLCVCLILTWWRNLSYDRKTGERNSLTKLNKKVTFLFTIKPLTRLLCLLISRPGLAEVVVQRL